LRSVSWITVELESVQGFASLFGIDREDIVPQFVRLASMKKKSGYAKQHPVVGALWSMPSSASQ